MSVFFVQNKGWRYNFYLNKNRYAKGFYATKNEARIAESKRKEAIQKGLPDPEEERRIEIREEPAAIAETTPTGMAFLDLVNRRIDHVKAYNTHKHYMDHVYLGRKWIARWGNVPCSSISRDMIESYLLNVSISSAKNANKYLKYLRSTFNYGLKQGWIDKNPTSGIEFFPMTKTAVYVPSKEDITEVINVADTDDKEYLCCFIETMGRMSEINNLKWDDVNFRDRYVVLLEFRVWRPLV